MNAKTPAASNETRDRILDAAESLFADNGFRAVSLRRITTEAGVNLASVNYHFGGKDGLIFEVLTRVVGPINEERLSSLDIAEAEAEAKGKPVPIREVLDAFFRPVVNQLGGANHNSQVYLKLAGRCLSEGEMHSPETLLRLFEKVADRFVTALLNSLPHLDETDVFWRLHLSVGTLLHALAKGSQLVLFSRGRIPTVEAEETLEQLIQYTAGGMKAAPVKKRAGKNAVLAALLAGCFLFTSCSAVSPPDAKHLTQLEIPAHWVAGDGFRPAHFPDTFWVDQFQDKDLSAFVREALENNRDLKAARARLEIALANAKIAGADLYPQINGNFTNRRSKQNFIGFPFSGPGGGGGGGILSNTNNQFGLSLDISWEVDLWGRVKAAETAAMAEFEASEFDRATAQLSIAGQAVKGWLALAEAKDQLMLAHATLSVFQETEGSIRERFENGLDEGGQSLASQLLLSEADIATAEDTLEARKELIGRASRQLEVLAGKYPAARTGKSASLPGFPSKGPVSLPGTLLDRRPDLAAAERRIAAADQRLLEAKRALLPAISLSTSSGTSSEQISDLLDSSFSVWSLAGNLAQPIFRGGVLRAGKARRQAEIDLSAANFEQAALTAFAEVENALAAEGFFSKRISSLSRAAQLSDEAYNRALQEYNGGTGDLLTVLTAQQATFNRKSQLIALKRLRLENRVDLYLALGGSFQPYEAPPHKEVNDT